jgi:hypothetical protein
MPASQPISLPSNIARPCGSQEFGTKSAVSCTDEINSFMAMAAAAIEENGSK